MDIPHKVEIKKGPSEDRYYDVKKLPHRFLEKFSAVHRGVKTRLDAKKVLILNIH